MAQDHDTDEIRKTRRIERTEEVAKTAQQPAAVIPPAPPRQMAKLPPKPAPKPRNTSLFPPFWSIVLTVLIVAICASSLVLAVLLLGGNTAPAQAPRIVVITAAPISTFTSGSTVLITATLPPDALPGQLQIPSTFVMEGPTLPPPNITPTPMQVAVGRTVRIVDVGEQQLNVRERPGVIDVPIAFLAPQNSLFQIIDGPTQADGLTWWRIQSVENNRSGWAAANYLEVVPEEVP
jgi:hypothetical protein